MRSIFYMLLQTRSQHSWRYELDFSLIYTSVLFEASRQSHLTASIEWWIPIETTYWLFLHHIAAHCSIGHFLSLIYWQHFTLPHHAAVLQGWLFSQMQLITCVFANSFKPIIMWLNKKTNKTMVKRPSTVKTCKQQNRQCK